MGGLRLIKSIAFPNMFMKAKTKDLSVRRPIFWNNFEEVFI